jgi:hypothetical protein
MEITLSPSQGRFFRLRKKNVSDLPDALDALHLIGQQRDFNESHALAIGFPKLPQILTLHGLPPAMERAIGFLNEVVDDEMTHGQMKSLKILQQPLGQANAETLGNGYDDIRCTLPVTDKV